MAKNGGSTSKISVWWDIENCHVPKNVDPHYIAQNLRSALHDANLNGPITIDLFGDTRNLDHRTLEALSSTGITINHIPSGNKDAADKAILVAMLFWALDNSPPAHFLLISGDGDFANALHRLRLKGYNILLARPDQPVKPALLGAATSIWYWTNVARGQISVSGEEPSGRFSSNLVGNEDFMKVELHRQQASPKIVSQHTASWLGLSGVFTNEGAQSLNQRIAPLQESERLGKIMGCKVPKPQHVKSETSNCIFDEKGSWNQRDISPTVCPYPWISDCGTKTSISCKDMGRFDEDTTKLEPELQADWKCGNELVSHTPVASSTKQVGFPPNKHLGNLGHLPRCSEDQGSDFSKHSRGISFVSSNKITDHTKPPLATVLPMPTVVEYLPSLSQDAIRAYNSNIVKIMKNFERLQMNGLMPTQGNLQDCLCYWDKQHGNIDLRQVLDHAVHLQHIKKVWVGEGAFTYFLPHNTQLWKCFDISDMMYGFSDELWKDFHEFLCCSKNWHFFVHSQSMYEAAQRLKGNGQNGIRELAVGEIILFLNQAIRKRNWLSLEFTPTFVLSIKPQVVMEQNPSEGSACSISRASKNDKGFVANATCTNGSAEIGSLYDASTKLLIFAKLRTWLLETSQTRPDYDVSLVPKDFQKATGIHLDIRKLGFTRLQGLIEEFDDVVTIKLVRRGLNVLSPAIEVNSSKQALTFANFQDNQQKEKQACQNTAVGPAVTTKDEITSQDNVRLGVSQICLPKNPAPDRVSPNQPACVLTASKDIAPHAHPPSVAVTTWNAGAFQNSSERASRNHPSLRKLRKWLLQLPSLNDGYDLSLIKKDFHQATGISLNPPSLGYPKVKDILNEFRNDFHVESPRKGLYLLFLNDKTRKSNAGINDQRLGRQSSGHVVGQEVTPRQNKNLR